MKNIVKKSIAATLALTTAFSVSSLAAACGSLKLDSIVVDQTTFDREYTMGDNVDFAGIAITAKYNDNTTKTLTLAECKVTYEGQDITNNLNVLTQGIGNKTVKVEYEGVSATFTVVVYYQGGGTTLNVNVAAFETPSAYLSAKNQMAAAGTDAYGEEDYESQFENADTPYVAGDDNAFKFVPTLRYMAAAGMPVTATRYETDTVIAMKEGNEYVDLLVRDGSAANTVEYYKDSTVYATAFTDKNEYDFTDEAIGGAFKLSVLPAPNYQFAQTATPVSCELEVVDGYNVYTAQELSVIDNNPLEENGKPRNHWANIKQSLGLTGIDPASVILQNDIKMTAADLPSVFTYTLDAPETWYTMDDFNGGKQNPIVGDQTFLYEKLEVSENAYAEIFSHRLEEGDSFKIHGNYHTLNLEELPLVRATGDYAYDNNDIGSNATLIRIQGYAPTEDEEGPFGDFEMRNLQVKGNANIVNYVEGIEGDPVYAGGIIFAKFNNTTAVVDNVIERTCVMGLFPEYTGSKLTVKNTKIYDSYQDAIFGWDGVDVSIQNSNLERSGGPLIMSQIEDVDTKAAEYAPKYVIDDDSILVNYVTGDEFWFVANGAEQVVGGLTALNAVFSGFAQATQTTARSITKSVDGLNKMNFIALIMPDGGPEAAIKWQTQGYLSYGGCALDRSMATEMGQKVFLAFQRGSTMMFNTLNSFGYMDATSAPVFMDTYEVQPGVTMNHANMLVPVMDGDQVVGMQANQNFVDSNYLTINYGGLAMFLEFAQVA